MALIGPNRTDAKTGEQRWQVIGRVAGLAVLLVIFVDRTKNDDEETIRLISARRAGKRESRRYFQQALTKRQLAMAKRLAAKQRAGDDWHIDFSDIPELTDAQLAEMAPLRAARPKVPVSVRLEPRVLEWLKSQGPGHLTRINDILVACMTAAQKR